jgi:beta-mannosidase
MEHHNKQVGGTERLYRFMAAHYSVPRDWEDFLYTGQLLQADALKCAVEHWRRRKFWTAGALFWQLNDCWPVTSWSVIDSALRPKAAYYAARRFFAPVLVSFAPTEGGVEVWGTNDFLYDLKGRLALRLLTFRGEVLASKTMPVRIPANASIPLFTVPEGWLRGWGSYMRAELTDGGRAVSVNRFFFAEPKHSKLPAARIRLGLRKTGPESYRAMVRSDVFALGVVFSSRGGMFHDNFVDLDPGVPHEIAITSRLSAAALRRSLKIRALNPRTAEVQA